eukprot:m.459881 g.459881  ORF g.459881 m.459881 type:complete len:65 (+) comp21846_c0_seq1:2546-2740(+)
MTPRQLPLHVSASSAFHTDANLQNYENSKGCSKDEQHNCVSQGLFKLEALRPHFSQQAAQKHVR